MGAGPRNYTKKTLKRLFALSGNQCAFPGCQERLVNTENALESNICHIEAAKVGGERYNPDMTDVQRADYANLILLCRQHHDLTNDVQKYTVDVLRKMKQEHESSYLNKQIQSNPSMLRNVINAISEISFDHLDGSETLNVYNPKEKLDYNSVKTNYAIIQEYKVYHEKINSLYDELEIQGSIKKEKLLNNIKQIYVKVKGEFVLNSEDPIAIIRRNADQIIDTVFDNLYEKLSGSDFFEEDLALGVRLIMVDAFIRCKILEEPRTE